MSIVKEFEEYFRWEREEKERINQELIKKIKDGEDKNKEVEENQKRLREWLRARLEAAKIEKWVEDVASVLNLKVVVVYGGSDYPFTFGYPVYKYTFYTQKPGFFEMEVRRYMNDYQIEFKWGGELYWSFSDGNFECGKMPPHWFSHGQKDPTKKSFPLHKIFDDALMRSTLLTCINGPTKGSPGPTEEQKKEAARVKEWGGPGCDCSC